MFGIKKDTFNILGYIEEMNDSCVCMDEQQEAVRNLLLTNIVLQSR